MSFPIPPARPKSNGPSPTPSPSAASTQSLHSAVDRQMMIHMRILLPLLLCAGVFAQPPKEWTDPDTHHRVIRLTDEPGSASLYFNQNGYTPDGKYLVYTTPNGISTFDLETRATRQVVAGPARIIEVGHKTGSVFYIKEGSIFVANIDSGAT